MPANKSKEVGCMTAGGLAVASTWFLLAAMRLPVLVVRSVRSSPILLTNSKVVSC